MLNVCVLLLFAVFNDIHTELLLQCYYREIVNIQVRLRDVQGLGVDNHCTLVLGGVHPKHPTGGPSTIERDFPIHPASVSEVFDHHNHNRRNQSRHNQSRRN
jgi:hypothetical protein